MHYQEFLREFNASPWKGAVTEVGIGVNFINELTLTPGTSKTLLHAECPYFDPILNGNVRAVSLANANRLATHALTKVEKQDEHRDIGLGPEHDFASHGADAAGLMSIVFEEFTKQSPELGDYYAAFRRHG